MTPSLIGGDQSDEDYSPHLYINHIYVGDEDKQLELRSGSRTYRIGKAKGIIIASYVDQDYDEIPTTFSKLPARIRQGAIAKLGKPKKGQVAYDTVKERLNALNLELGRLNHKIDELESAKFEVEVEFSEACKLCPHKFRDLCRQDFGTITICLDCGQKI